MNFFTFILAILQLCCTTESQKNIALNGTASQSSVFNWYNNGNPTDMTAVLAITGLPTNDINTQSCSMTRSNFYEAWWMLTFSVDTVFVSSVKIFLRKDTLYRNALYFLYISNTSISTQTPGRPPYDDLCYHDVGPDLPQLIQNLDCYSLGKNVIIYNNRTKGGVVVNNDPYAYLELCGVQVFGCYKGWSGNDCLIPCPGGCIDKHCFPNNGTCVWGCVPDNCLRDNCDYATGVCVDGCKPGLAGRFCNKYNLAFNKPTEMQPADKQQNTKFAVDGNRTVSSCIITSGSISWLQVDFMELSVITSVYLSYKNDNIVKIRSEGHSIFVTNTSGSWTNDSRLSLNSSDNFPYITYDISPVIGQYVIYVPVTTNGTGYTDICEIEVIGCQAGKYGENCNMSCPVNCNDACHSETGDCIFGCNGGWQGVKCDNQCTSPYFGNSCKQVCNCLNNAKCNIVNGTCPPGGCQKGWKGDSCNIACNTGSYGYNCNQTCSGCVLSQCDKINGTCNITGTCNPGWRGPRCNEPCNSGTFGKDCAEVCHCINQTCNHISGECPSGGCQRGYEGDSCSTNCTIGYFGFNCNESCDGCLSNSCEPFTGNCTNTTGCNPGWQYGYSKCDIACPDGYFGDCKSRCYCLEGACNKTTGICPDSKVSKCQKGWMGDTCSKDCNNGTYGFSCKNSCNNCRNQSCEIFDGNCTFGCIKEYYGHQCQFLVSVPQTGETSNMAGSIGGGIVAAVVILVILIVVVVIFRRRHKSKHPNHSAGGNPSVSGLKDNIYSNVNKKPSTKMNDNTYVNVNAIADSEDVKLFLPSVSGSNNTTTIKTEYAISQHVDEENENSIDHVYGNSESEQNSSKYNIAVKDLQSVINEKQNNDGFTKEYEILPKGLVRPHVAGSKEENKSKNRFLNTWPYDHSRVVLKGNASSDYINASYIDSYSKRQAYIATQGPKKNTIKDFWQMIWQENAEVIVMVTRLEEEEGKKKCTQYWPESSTQPFLQGIYQVTMVQETEYTVYVYRRMQIFNTKSKQERTVHHFHFTQWPDHGVPDSIKLISFYRKVKLADTSLNAPMIVHCSAGLGRTGTFIAVDALYENGTKTGNVDIIGYVQIMRKDRMNMIQTKEQYEAVYEALLELFTVPDTAIGVGSFCQHFATLQTDAHSSSNRLRHEFQKIADLKPVYTSKSFRASKLKDNTCKNVDQNILAHDNYRPFLMSFEGSRNDYINAVIIPDYEGKTKFLVTQYPLQETVVDFWTMVYDNDCTAVALIESVDNTIPLWPVKDDTLDFKILSVKQGKDNLPLSMEIVLHHKKKNDTRTVQIMIMDEWSEENIPHSTKCMHELLDKVSKWREQHPSPITVVCKDGCRRSGLLVALDLILEKMKIDNEVDIFQVVRTIQIRRPEFLSSFDQYEFCYQCIKDILEEDESLYANV